MSAIFTGSIASSAEGVLPYTDVKETDWFFDCVSEVYNSNLMIGTAGNRFEPQTAMSRAMFITVLGRLDGAEQSESDRFSDINLITTFLKDIPTALSSRMLLSHVRKWLRLL